MSFTLEINRSIRKTKTKLEAVRKGATIKFLNAVVLDTPVDEGRLRGNWRFSEQTPLLAPVSNADKSGQGVIKQIEQGVKGSLPGVLFLTNNLPYAVVAENGLWNGPTDLVTSEGFSRKSPEGFVKRNLVRFNTLIRIENRKR